MTTHPSVQETPPEPPGTGQEACAAQMPSPVAVTRWRKKQRVEEIKRLLEVGGAWSCGRVGIQKQLAERWGCSRNQITKDFKEALQSTPLNKEHVAELVSFSLSGFDYSLRVATDALRDADPRVRLRAAGVYASLVDSLFNLLGRVGAPGVNVEGVQQQIVGPVTIRWRDSGLDGESLGEPLVYRQGPEK